MIHLNASNKLINTLKEFNITIDALQHILTFILRIYTPKYDCKNANIKIVCRKNTKNYGLYEFESKKIVICTSCLGSKESFLSALLHEFRLWIQHSVDGISPIAIISKGIKYEDNAYEQQCCTFENILLPSVLELLEHYNLIYKHFNQ